MKYALGVLGAFVLYEVLRDRIAAELRRNTPVILQQELRNRSPSAGLLAPLIGTPAISNAFAVVVEQSVLDTLPTVIGRTRARGND